MAHQRALGRQSQQARGRAGRDDQRAGRHLDIVVADDERPPAEIDVGDVAVDDFGPEPLRLGAHLVHQRRPHDAVAMPRQVLDQRGQRELTARLESFDEQRIEVGPGRIEGRGQAGRA